MTSTDLKPGDIVQHPEKGNGIVNRRFARDDVGVMYADLYRDGISSFAIELTGWERVEIVRPGHVQVRVDDLDPQTLSEWSQYAGCNLVETALLRVGCASIARQAGQGDPTAQRAESTPPADEQERDEKPMSATVELFCPDCGEATPVTVVMLGRQSNGERWFDLREKSVHHCPPAQPDEPTEFGARITVTRPDDARITAIHPDGSTEKWLRADRAARNPWVGEASSSECSWDELTQRGTVTIGWDE